MNLTKGQKEALQRKAEQIVNAKIEARKEKLRENWRPSPEAKKFLGHILEIEKTRKLLKQQMENLGFTPNYYEFNKTVEGVSVGVPMSPNNLGENIYDSIKEQLINKYVENEIAKEDKYPSMYSIIDEIELLTLSKDFSIDDFLAKYNAL